MVVDDGKKVKIHYTGTLTKEGTQFDSSVGKDPFEFVVGAESVIKGFDDGVKEMEVGDKKTINIPSAEAYGAYLDDLVKTFPLDSMKGTDVTPGQTVLMSSEDGKKFPCMIKEIKEEEVLVDFNHPLAGKDLTFELELLSVE